MNDVKIEMLSPGSAKASDAALAKGAVYDALGVDNNALKKALGKPRISFRPNDLDFVIQDIRVEKSNVSHIVIGVYPSLEYFDLAVRHIGSDSKIKKLADAKMVRKGELKKLVESFTGSLS